MGFIEDLFDFSFTEFVTSRVVQVLYTLSVIAVGLVSIVLIFALFGQGAGAGLLGLILVPLGALLVLAYIRVALEFVVVLFRIYDNTCRIAEHGPLAAPASVPDLAAPLPSGGVQPAAPSAGGARPAPYNGPSPWTPPATQPQAANLPPINWHD